MFMHRGLLWVKAVARKDWRCLLCRRLIHARTMAAYRPVTNRKGRQDRICVQCAANFTGIK